MPSYRLAKCYLIARVKVINKYRDHRIVLSLRRNYRKVKYMTKEGKNCRSSLENEIVGVYVSYSLELSMKQRMQFSQLRLKGACWSRDSHSKEYR